MFKLNVLRFANFAIIFAVPALAQKIMTVAGGGPNNMPAVSANLNGPIAAGLDASGNLYTGIQFFKVFRVDKSGGQLTLYAGGGYSSADGVTAVSANLCMVGMAVDSAGNVFIADGCTSRIRRVDAAMRVITTVAGNGVYGYTGDGGPATSAELGELGAVTLDSAGNVFLADGARIRRVNTATHVITTVAGNGMSGYSGDGGPATSAKVNVDGLWIDRKGNLFVADGTNQRIRRVDAATGVITTVAGNGYQNPFNPFLGGYSGDGGPATSAELNHPTGVAVDRAGNLFIADTFNDRVRRVDGATGIITTVAGNGTRGFSGDGGPATSAALFKPVGITIDGTGTLFIVDSGNERIRRMDAATQVITTAAGNGECCVSGDGGPATSADGLGENIALDRVGNLFIGGGNRVRRVDATSKVINTVAGSDHPLSLGDGGPATSAYLNLVADVELDSAGNLFIVDTNQHLVRRVDGATQVITTVAGKTGPNCFPCGGFGGDGGPATSALLAYPDGVTVDSAGNLFISDGNNERVRRVDRTTQVITTFAGNGYQSYYGGGFGGDGGPATSAELNGPNGLAVDRAGNLFIADTVNQRIRRVDATTRVITTVAGNGYQDPSDPAGTTGGFSGDGGPATSAELNQPTDVAVDSAGNLFIADHLNFRIRRVDAATGIITTVAGNGTLSFSGDGGPATSAQLVSASSVAVDNQGNLFIGDGGRVREVFGGDVTPPVIVPQVTGTLGKNGWYVSKVTVSWSVTSPGSTIVSSSGCGTTVLTADTQGVTLTCRATNAAGLSSSAPATVKIETTPPNISGMPPQSCTLWPPNSKLVQIADVTARASVSGLAPGSLVVGAASNEPSGLTGPDTVITPDGSGGFIVQLRADRLGTGNGRVYTIQAKAASNAGNSTAATAICTAPLYIPGK